MGEKMQFQTLAETMQVIKKGLGKVIKLVSAKRSKDDCITVIVTLSNIGLVSFRFLQMRCQKTHPFSKRNWCYCDVQCRPWCCGLCVCLMGLVRRGWVAQLQHGTCTLYNMISLLLKGHLSSWDCRWIALARIQRVLITDLSQLTGH